MALLENTFPNSTSVNFAGSSFFCRIDIKFYVSIFQSCHLAKKQEVVCPLYRCCPRVCHRVCHLCTWSKLHQMFLKYGSFGALSQWFITEHFLVSFGGLLYTFQCPASRVCGHFSVSLRPLQCGQSCPMFNCLKLYV